MILTVWDREVAPHLHRIEDGADMAVRHAKALPIRPNFLTNAEDKLSEAERVLEEALNKVRAAMAEYGQKEIAV